MPLGKTFFSELYGMVTDKFGITWQLSLTSEANNSQETFIKDYKTILKII